MSRLRVMPIVEGDGESNSIRILLQRLWTFLGGEFIDVLRPIRQPRSRLIQIEHLRKALDFAAAKLTTPALTQDRSLVLLLIDADEDKPCVLGPKLVAAAKACHSDLDVACIVANVEYETWFVAAAESLQTFLRLPDLTAIPPDPEASRSRKAWIQSHFRGARYSETVDQPRMTSQMDLGQCRTRSPSFDKLCRELEKRL